MEGDAVTGELRVRVQPRASRSEAVGFRDGVLHLRLTAPPVGGAANRACQQFLAALLGIAPGRVRLVGGEKSREKRFVLHGLTSEAAHAKIEARLAGGGRGRD